jgi:hypothetical protein
LAFLEGVRTHGMPSSKERRYRHLQLPLVLNQWLAIAAIHGAEGGLTDPRGAPLVGPDVVAALAHRHTARKHADHARRPCRQAVREHSVDDRSLLTRRDPKRPRREPGGIGIRGGLYDQCVPGPAGKAVDGAIMARQMSAIPPSRAVLHEVVRRPAAPLGRAGTAA